MRDMIFCPGQETLERLDEKVVILVQSCFHRVFLLPRFFIVLSTFLRLSRSGVFSSLLQLLVFCVR